MSEVVTFIIITAELTTYSLENRVVKKRQVNIAVPEAEMEDSLRDWVRQRIPKEG